MTLDFRKSQQEINSGYIMPLVFLKRVVYIEFYFKKGRNWTLPGRNGGVKGKFDFGKKMVMP